MEEEVKIPEKTPAQVDAEKRLAEVADVKAKEEAYRTECAKGLADASNLAEITAMQEANEKAGLIFEPVEPEELVNQALAKNQKREATLDQIEEMADSIVNGEHEVAPALSALIEAYKILYP